MFRKIKWDEFWCINIGAEQISQKSCDCLRELFFYFHFQLQTEGMVVGHLYENHLKHEATTEGQLQSRGAMQKNARAIWRQMQSLKNDQVLKRNGSPVDDISALQKQKYQREVGFIR